MIRILVAGEATFEEVASILRPEEFLEGSVA